MGVEYVIQRKEEAVPPVLKNTLYESYNEARTNIRRWLLLQMVDGKYERTQKDKANRTVTIGDYGFSILEVNA